MANDNILNSYFRKVSRETGKDIYDLGLKLIVGQVVAIHFIDNASNLSKEYVEYDVICKDAYGGQSTFRNVRAISSTFGSNDFDETVLEPNEVAFQGRLDSSNFFKNQNGTTVIVGFIDASFEKPLIMGTIPHPRKQGATSVDGIRMKREFRGMDFEINKDGELIITYQGNRNPDGSFVRADTAPTIIKIGKEGKFTITDNNKQSFEINRVDGTITLTNTEGKIFKLADKQILGQGTEPVVLGDTLESILTTFLISLETGIIPGSPGQNAASLLVIKTAATALKIALPTMKSPNSTTD